MLSRSHSGLLAALAALANGGCIAAGGYFGAVPASPARQAIESRTGAPLFDSWGARLGLDIRDDHFHFVTRGRDEAGRPRFSQWYWWHAYDFEVDFVSEGARVSRLTAGAFLSRDMVRRRLSRPSGLDLTLLIGGAVGPHHLHLDDAPDGWGLGGYASLGLIFDGALGPWYLEARYRFAGFDTDSGRLDASGVEVVFGVRYNYAMWMASRLGE